MSLAVLGTAASIAGLATYSQFTSSTSASQSIATGTVIAALGTAGGTTNRLTIGATALAPGDTVQRVATLSNTGTIDFSTVTLTTTASTSTLLDTDATNGLQMVVDKCSLAWVEAGTAPAYTYTCLGTTTTIIASRAVIGATLAMPGLSSLTAGSADNLRVTLTLPSAAGNTFQSLSSVLLYTFNATQRTATSK